MVLNLAEAVRLRSTGKREHVLPYAIGSTLECAAGLDIATLKQWVGSELALREKRGLCEVVKMLVGLRKGWARAEFREDPADYGEGTGILFEHERLEAYQRGLDFMRWFHGQPGAAELSSRLLRQVDKAGTSVVLNIAEANGRYASGDRRSLLDIAEASVVRAGAYLELCARAGEMDANQKRCGLDCLGRVASMVRALAAG
jgi:four helix bundle protein